MDLKPATGIDAKKEAIGWVSIVSFILLFPILFFLFVFLPIWVGWTPRP